MAALSNPYPSYNYTPLFSSDSLRLLKLRPSSASRDDIDCELFQASLVSTDQYEDRVPLQLYDAVSWSLGNAPQDRQLRVNEDDQFYSLPISSDLEAALRALRYVDQTRLLWVDAICINQRSDTERSQQVLNMNQIYGQARNVCIWIGEEDETSHQAIDFIKERVLKLWDFDKLREDSRIGERWQAMSMLMKRPWFSRRWALQEIALAKRAILYCGRDIILWQDFADAVSLFVQAESVPHKLSNATQKSQNFDQIPDFYGNVPALGAARLVNATSSLFRSSKNDQKEQLERLLSLEYLVSKYTDFEVTEPRDTIYAFLTIARDTTPEAIIQELPDKFQKLAPDVQQMLRRWFRKALVSTAYLVDYGANPIEVYQKFIAFSISKSEPKCALNVICRPWAPSIPSASVNSRVNGSVFNANGATVHSGVSSITLSQALPSWIPDVRGAAFVMPKNANTTAEERIYRSNADPLVGMPGDRTYSASGSKSISLNKLKWCNNGNYYSMFVEGFIFDQVAEQEEVSRAGIISPKWLELAKWENTNKDPPEEFWRTLVANRGPNGQNTQPYYPRACKEAMTRRSSDRGLLETRAVIEHTQSSIIAEFLRRVQAVIWNRRLIRTGNGHLGLAHEDSRSDDLICILYGCNVPVTLRRFEKSPEAIEKERAFNAAKQNEMVIKAMKMLRYALGERKRRPNNEFSSWTNWKSRRIVIIVVLLSIGEFRSGLNVWKAAVLNSLLLFVPQSVYGRSSYVNGKICGRIPQWAQFPRWTCTVFLFLRILDCWINSTIEGELVAVSIVVLLQSLLWPGEEYAHFLHRFWFRDFSFKRATRALKRSIIHSRVGEGFVLEPLDTGILPPTQSSPALAPGRPRRGYKDPDSKHHRAVPRTPDSANIMPRVPNTVASISTNSDSMRASQARAETIPELEAIPAIVSPPYFLHKDTVDQSNFKSFDSTSASSSVLYSKQDRREPVLESMPEVVQEVQPQEVSTTEMGSVEESQPTSAQEARPARPKSWFERVREAWLAEYEDVPRPVPEPEKYYWQLIGECYVDGMMDGEAIAYQNERRERIKPQVFELR